MNSLIWVNSTINQRPGTRKQLIMKLLNHAGPHNFAQNKHRFFIIIYRSHKFCISFPTVSRHFIHVKQIRLICNWLKVGHSQFTRKFEYITLAALLVYHFV